MKPFDLIFTGLLLSVSILTLSAQKVKIKKDQVFVNKQGYCLTDCKGLLTQDCTVRTAEGKVIASLVLHIISTGPESEKRVYEIFFTGTDYKAQMIKEFSFAKKLVKQFYIHQVLKDGALNEAGVQEFCRVYSRDLITEYNQQRTSAQATTDVVVEDKYTVAERDRSSSISIFSDEIKQDFVLIGRLAEEDFFNNGEQMQRIKVFLPNGTLVANAEYKYFADERKCKIITLKDNKAHQIILDTSSRLDDEEEIVRYLVELYYL